MKELSKEEFHKLAIKFLLYSFEFPNHIIYNELSKEEKEICNEEEFASLIRLLKNENSKE